MKNIEKWLKRNGYKVRKIQLTGERNGLAVDTDYSGLYPGKEQFEALEKIRRHMSAYYPQMTVEPRGHYTAIFIY